MSAFRKLKGLVYGQDMEKVHAQLETAGVPTSLESCRTCADPCEDHEEWPNKFSIDTTSQLLGNVKPYNRQLVISTGRKDWAHDISEEDGSLAQLLDKARDALPKTTHQPTSAGKPTVDGVFPASSTNRISLLNGSYRTISHDDTEQTVLVFPDYTFVVNVKTSLDGAKDFWQHSVDPSLGQGGAPSPAAGLQTKVLPYSCVILLCSHKKRDNRCSIAAPKLEAAFTHSLQNHHWGVDTQLDEGMFHDQTPLEDFSGTSEDRTVEITNRLKQAADGGHEKRALIVYNSHMGGHKFAGNVIIYMPTGVGIWYGRVSTHEVEAVVTNTIIGGKVLPPLLRGGANLQRPGCASLLDW